MICPKCRAQKIDAEAIFCHECGSPYPKLITTPSASADGQAKAAESGNEERSRMSNCPFCNGVGEMLAGPLKGKKCSHCRGTGGDRAFYGLKDTKSANADGSSRTPERLKPKSQAAPSVTTSSDKIASPMKPANGIDKFMANTVDLLLSFFIGGSLFNLLELLININNIVKLLSIILFMWLYFKIMHCSLLQATFGKAALGMKVTTLNGNRLSFWERNKKIVIAPRDVFSKGAVFILALLICFSATYVVSATNEAVQFKNAVLYEREHYRKYPADVPHDEEWYKKNEELNNRTKSHDPETYKLLKLHDSASDSKLERKYKAIDIFLFHCLQAGHNHDSCFDMLDKKSDEEINSIYSSSFGEK